jgi:hypothetical protein
MEFVSSLLKSINTAVPFYNEILGLEDKVINDGKQISKIIAQLDFVNGVRNAKLRNMLQKVQDKYTVLVSLIGKLTEEKRKYMEKMMYIVSNKQKTLQGISEAIVKNARNPLNKIIRDQLQGRELVSLMRSYYEQSVSFNKYADARSVVNHRLNALYNSLNSLQMDITRALQDFMNQETYVRIDQTSQQMAHNIRRLTDLEGSLISAEQAILTADTKLNMELDVPDFAKLKMVGGGYLEDLLKGFSSLQAGQTGGVVDQSRVALLPNVVPKLHEVDMVSFGGILQQRLNECQAAFSNVRNRLKDWADFDNIFLSIMNKGEKMENIAAQLQINKNTYQKLITILNSNVKLFDVNNGTDVSGYENSNTLEVLSEEIQRLTMNVGNISNNSDDIIKNIININVFESFIKQYCEWIVSMYRNWQCDPSAITTSGLAGKSNEELKKLKEKILVNIKTQIENINKNFKLYTEALKDKNISADPKLSGKTPMEILMNVKQNNNYISGGKKRRSAKKSSKKHRGGKKKSSKKKSSKKHRGGKKKSSKRRSSKKRSSGRR